MYNYYIQILCCTFGISSSSYYDMLEISRQATHQEIRKAYHRKAKSLHPDKNRNPQATEAFQKLSNIYHELSNPESRTNYDTYIENSCPEITCRLSRLKN